MKTTILHALTRPRGCCWLCTLEAVRLEAGLPVGSARATGVGVTPTAWALRGGLAAFLLLYSLFWNWERVPWPRWPAQASDVPEGIRLSGPCGCMFREEPREADPKSDTTLLVRYVDAGVRPPAAYPPGEPLR